MTEEKTPKRRGRPPRLPRSSGVAGSEATATPEVFEPRRGRKSAAAAAILSTEGRVAHPLEITVVG